MTLPMKKLGSTDIEVSLLGLGTIKFGRNTDVKYPESFTIPTDEQAQNLLSLAKDNGINTLDTAPAYGNSEERLGKLLKGQRNDWVIVGKAGEEYVNLQSSHHFNSKHIMSSIKRSLQRLKTDYIDVLLIHSNGDDVGIIKEYDVFGTLDAAKQQGLIRASGMSTKTVEGGILTLQHADCAMVCYNPDHTDELKVIDYAKEHNKGIFIKKAFGSGHLDAKECMNFILEKDAISSIVVGTINPEHLQQNIKLATG